MPEPSAMTPHATHPVRAAQPASPPAALMLARDSEVGPHERRALVLLIGLVHVAAGWALLQVESVRAAARDVAPLMVDLVAPPAQAAPPPLPPPPLPRPVPAMPADPAPLLTAPPAPAPAVFVAPEPPPEPAPAAVAVEPAPVVAPTPPLPPPSSPPSPPRKVVSVTAVDYLRLPPVEVPRMSRRAGESGTVWLRVVVDVRGQPVHVSVQRSSGHPRLDEQALWAMRHARFKPQTENGQPVELEVTAPIEYTLE